MTTGSTFRRTLRRLCRDRRGNYGMMMAALAPMLLLGVGFGINIAQVSTARSNLLAALDSAVTSTARDLTTGAIEEKDARATVEAFLLANGRRAFSEGDRVTLDSIEIDTVNSTVTATASVVVDVAFPLFGAANRQTISTQSAAIYSDKRIEIAMMLDVTDSMAPDRRGRNDKIGDLRNAAARAVERLLASNRPGNPRVRIALVPYSDGVNAGPLSHAVYQETSSDRGASHEPPRLNDPRPAAASAPTRCATEREGTYQFSDVGPGTAMVNLDYVKPACPSAAIMPLTADKSALEARIASLSTIGYTAGQVGVQWSWYMLSPQWASVMPVSARPEDHDPRRVAKFAILMTDGEFNTAYADVEYTTKPSRADNVRSQATKSRSYAERLCREMKKQGIEIFSIGFQLSSGAKAVMRNCASTDTGSVKHYFEASTGAELDLAYQTIANNIERLALTR